MGLFATKDHELKIEGMTCGHCVATVEAALGAVAGVRKAKVDLDAGTAWVRTKPDTDATSLIKAVVEAGYDARSA